MGGPDTSARHGGALEVRVLMTGEHHADARTFEERQQLDQGRPDRFVDAHTMTWSNHAHFLLVTIARSTMAVRVIGDLGRST